MKISDTLANLAKQQKTSITMGLKDFKLSSQLGKGTYGSVYKVRRKSDGNAYALKEVSIKALSHKERQDAVNEIRILASVNHHNVLRYMEGFVEHDKLYIVTAFAERGDLHKKLERVKSNNRILDESLLWSYFIQTACGVAALHRQSILHRDLKPRNIFIFADNHIMVGDLGSSKLTKGNMAKTQVGTPYYMCPEIWMRHAYNDKSDVWALGCIMYELAMLKPPFGGVDMKSLSHNVCWASTPLVSRKYSADVRKIVNMCLAKNPIHRPTVEDILRMPCVASRFSTLPQPIQDTLAEMGLGGGGGGGVGGVGAGVGDQPSPLPVVAMGGGGVAPGGVPRPPRVNNGGGGGGGALPSGPNRLPDPRGRRASAPDLKACKDLLDTIRVPKEFRNMRRMDLPAARYQPSSCASSVSPSRRRSARSRPGSAPSQRFPSPLARAGAHAVAPSRQQQQQQQQQQQGGGGGGGPTPPPPSGGNEVRGRGRGRGSSVGRRERSSSKDRRGKQEGQYDRVDGDKENNNRRPEAVRQHRPNAPAPRGRGFVRNAANYR